MNNFFLSPIQQQSKEQELLSVLEDYFHRPPQYRLNTDHEITAFFYSNSDGNPMLEVWFTKKGKIDKINSRLSKQETKALEQQIRSQVLDDNQNKIGQIICFADATVMTFYRCDHFQIIPVPTHAQKSRTIRNAPFLLQYTYPSSTNWRIDAHRRIERQQQYINLLTLFINIPLTTNPSQSSFIWTQDIEHHHIEQRFAGYTYEGFTPSVDVFSDISGYQESTLIPAEEYYSDLLAFRNVIIAGQLELRLPDNLCSSFEKVRSLDKKFRETFFKACYWLHQAQMQMSVSHSLSLVALITAIESLNEKKTCPECKQERVIASGHCKNCNEPEYKITEGFKEFVDKLLPGPVRDLKALSMLYGTRSSLLHGSQILLSDLQPWVHWTDNKQAFEQFNIYDQAYILTKVVLYNWLYGKQYS